MVSYRGWAKGSFSTWAILGVEKPHTVGWFVRNLARSPVDMVNIPLFIGFLAPSQVVGNGISEPSTVGLSTLFRNELDEKETQNCQTTFWICRHKILRPNGPMFFWFSTFNNLLHKILEFKRPKCFACWWFFTNPFENICNRQIASFPQGEHKCLKPPPRFCLWNSCWILKFPTLKSF